MYTNLQVEDALYSGSFQRQKHWKTFPSGSEMEDFNPDLVPVVLSTFVPCGWDPNIVAIQTKRRKDLQLTMLDMRCPLVSLECTAKCTEVCSNSRDFCRNNFVEQKMKNVAVRSSSSPIFKHFMYFSTLFESTNDSSDPNSIQLLLWQTTLNSYFKTVWIVLSAFCWNSFHCG